MIEDRGGGASRRRMATGNIALTAMDAVTHGPEVVSDRRAPRILCTREDNGSPMVSSQQDIRATRGRRKMCEVAVGAGGLGGLWLDAKRETLQLRTRNVF
jgi:hypothetical protein